MDVVVIKTPFALKYFLFSRTDREHFSDWLGFVSDGVRASIPLWSFDDAMRGGLWTLLKQGIIMEGSGE